MQRLNIEFKIPDEDAKEIHVTVGNVTEVVKYNEEEVTEVSHIFDPLAKKVEKLVNNHINNL